MALAALLLFASSIALLTSPSWSIRPEDERVFPVPVDPEVTWTQFPVVEVADDWLQDEIDLATPGDTILVDRPAGRIVLWKPLTLRGIGDEAMLRGYNTVVRINYDELVDFNLHEGVISGSPYRLENLVVEQLGNDGGQPALLSREGGAITNLEIYASSGGVGLQLGWRGVLIDGLSIHGGQESMTTEVYFPAYCAQGCSGEGSGTPDESQIRNLVTRSSTTGIHWMTADAVTFSSIDVQAFSVAVQFGSTSSTLDLANLRAPVAMAAEYAQIMLLNSSVAGEIIYFSITINDSSVEGDITRSNLNGPSRIELHDSVVRNSVIEMSRTTPSFQDGDTVFARTQFEQVNFVPESQSIPGEFSNSTLNGKSLDFWNPGQGNSTYAGTAEEVVVVSSFSNGIIANFSGSIHCFQTFLQIVDSVLDGSPQTWSSCAGSLTDTDLDTDLKLIEWDTGRSISWTGGHLSGELNLEGRNIDVTLFSVEVSGVLAGPELGNLVAFNSTQNGNDLVTETGFVGMISDQESLIGEAIGDVVVDGEDLQTVWLRGPGSGTLTLSNSTISSTFQVSDWGEVILQNVTITAHSDAAWFDVPLVDVRDVAVLRPMFVTGTLRGAGFSISSQESLPIFNTGLRGNALELEGSSIATTFQFTGLSSVNNSTFDPVLPNDYDADLHTLLLANGSGNTFHGDPFQLGFELELQTPICGPTIVATVLPYVLENCAVDAGPFRVFGDDITLSNFTVGTSARLEASAQTCSIEGLVVWGAADARGTVCTISDVVVHRGASLQVEGDLGTLADLRADAATVEVEGQSWQILRAEITNSSPGLVLEGTDFQVTDSSFRNNPEALRGSLSQSLFYDNNFTGNDIVLNLSETDQLGVRGCDFYFNGISITGTAPTEANLSWNHWVGLHNLIGVRAYSEPHWDGRSPLPSDSLVIGFDYDEPVEPPAPPLRALELPHPVLIVLALGLFVLAALLGFASRILMKRIRGQTGPQE